MFLQQCFSTNYNKSCFASNNYNISLFALYHSNIKPFLSTQKKRFPRNVKVYHMFSSLLKCKLLTRTAFVGNSARYSNLVMSHICPLLVKSQLVMFVSWLDTCSCRLLMTMKWWSCYALVLVAETASRTHSPLNKGPHH